LSNWVTVSTFSEGDDRGFILFPNRKQKGKVGIGCNNGSVAVKSCFEYHLIFGVLDANIPDMNGIVSQLDQFLRNEMGYSIVNKEFHYAAFVEISGNVLSRTVSAANSSAS
jgi:hypothetical protein